MRCTYGHERVVLVKHGQFGQLSTPNAHGCGTPGHRARWSGVHVLCDYRASCHCHHPSPTTARSSTHLTIQRRQCVACVVCAHEGALEAACGATAAVTARAQASPRPRTPHTARARSCSLTSTRTRASAGPSSSTGASTRASASASARRRARSSSEQWRCGHGGTYQHNPVQVLEPGGDLCAATYGARHRTRLQGSAG